MCVQPKHDSCDSSFLFSAIAEFYDARNHGPVASGSKYCGWFE